MVHPDINTNLKILGSADLVHPGTQGPAEHAWTAVLEAGQGLGSTVGESYSSALLYPAELFANDFVLVV
jgi:hypothetical protein